MKENNNLNLFKHVFAEEVTNTIQKNSQISKIVSLSVFLGTSCYIMSYSER